MIGTTLAHYRVTAALGEGGMGEVWRAEDEKLGREVALKVLPESFAQDPERLARFEREARVLASLNHPNIAHLYGLETAGAIPSDGRENSEFGIRNSELPATVSPDEGSGLEARGSSTSSHPAAGTAAPQSGPAPPDGLVGHASGVPGGVGGNSKLKTQNSKLTADAAASEVTFLVMELVEGEDLSERIRRGPIPVEEAVAIALQIAEALEAAHERGIVHRDLKPANIKLRPDGTVKVLDFGLAKAWEAEGPDPGLSLSPTVTKHATAAGLILGTAAYMSPEQARGTGVDRRADVWSFGVVLWEMLTGRKLFEGHTVSDVLASVLKEAPDLDALPAEVPPKLRSLLARCLEKDPRRRLQAIGEARIALELPLSAAAPVAAEAADGGQTRRSRIAAAVGWALAAVGLGAAALLLWQQLGRSPERVLRTSIPPPEGTTFHLSGINAGPAALSPDGTRIVFSARDEDGAVRLYLRVLDQPEARVLSGTETAQYPFWSPDSRWIGFFAQQDESMKKVDAAGGPPITLCAAPNGKGGSWGKDDVIVFTPNATTPLHRVSASGGESQPVTEIDRGRHNSHRHPRFLPDGRHFLYIARGISAAESVIKVGSLDGGVDRELTAATVQAEFAGGFLFFVRDRSLMAQPFDSKRLVLEGEASPVGEAVLTIPAAALGIYTVSPAGLLAYHTGSVEAAVAPAWYDRAGREISTLGDPGEYNSVVLSPDGRTAAFTVIMGSSGTFDIWLYDLARDLKSRFTFDDGMDWMPAWAPDGGSLAFASDRSGSFDLYRMAIGGVRGPELLVASDRDLTTRSWSPDGRWVIYAKEEEETSFDIWAAPADGDGDPRVVRAQPGLDVPGSVSPDGRWLSYISDESGTFEVYITPFPDASRRWQASTASGIYHAWCEGGRELVYQQVDGRLMSLEVDLGADSVRLGQSTPLFDIAPPEPTGPAFAPSPDCQRFLVIPKGEATETTLLNLVAGWPRVLEDR